MNQTFKHFWAHRRQNGFVFAEIALIAVLSFYFIDYIVVTCYDRYLCRPATQFETKHLLVGMVGIVNDAGNRALVRNNFAIGFEPDTTKMDPTLVDYALKNKANLFALRDKVRALPEVEYACLTDGFIDGQWHMIRSFKPEADTTRFCGAFMESFLIGQQYLETQGLKSIEGSPSAAVLSEECPEDGCIITRSMAIALFDTDQAVGRCLVEWKQMNDETEPHPHDRFTVAGVVEDFRIDARGRYAYSILTPVTSTYRSKLLIRLKPEADAVAFVSRLTLPGDLQAGKYALATIQTMKDYEKNVSYGLEDSMLYSLLGTFIGLLLLNVMLGTLGTFWLQIRKRTEDIGIMRSFGAKRRDVFWMLWREAALLTFIAAVVGQMIWLQFALNIGLATGFTLGGTEQETDWLSIFWKHYLVVCVIQYIILLIIVTLGMVVPTFRAMYKRPVEALHHE